MYEIDHLGLFNGLPESTKLKLQLELRDKFLELLGLKSEFKIWLEQNFEDIIQKIIYEFGIKLKDIKNEKEEKNPTKYIELLAELFGDD